MTDKLTAKRDAFCLMAARLDAALAMGGYRQVVVHPIRGLEAEEVRLVAEAVAGSYGETRVTIDFVTDNTAAFSVRPK